MLRRMAALAALVCTHLVVTATAAFADGCPDGQTPTPAPGGGVICIVVSDPGTPDEPGDDGTPSPGSSTCQRSDGTPVDCVTEWGIWDDAHQCWIHQVNVPSDDPVWEGHDDGSIWMCALITDADPVVTFWVPPGATLGIPDPGQLAQQAVGQLPLATAQVHTAPQHPARSYVGVENWLWVPQSQWTTLTKTVRAGGTSVTVTAAPDQVLWDMGAETKTCYAAGREWQSGMSDEATTTCGYTYRVTSASESDGVFALAATIRYQVDWVCTGACASSSGTLGLVDAPAGTGALRVMQRQTVVVQ